MTHKYQVELFEGDWGNLIGEYDSVEEAEEEYEKWNSRKLYEERKGRLYDSTKGWYYNPWTARGANRIKKNESLTLLLNEVTYDETGELVNYKNGSPVLTIKRVYYSGDDFLDDYRKEYESDDED